MDQQKSSSEQQNAQYQYCSIDEDPPYISLASVDNQNIVLCLKELNRAILKKSLKFSLNLKSVEKMDVSKQCLDNDSMGSSICFTESSLKSLLDIIKEKPKPMPRYMNFIQLGSVEMHKSISSYEILRNKLNKAFLCEFDACSDEDCIEGKKYVKTLQENIQNRHLGLDDSHTLCVLLEHCLKCKEIACKAVGCTQFSRRLKQSQEELMECIYSAEEFVQCDNTTQFFKFSNTCEFKSANDVKNCTKVKLKELPICGVSNLMHLNKEYVIVTKCQNVQHQQNYLSECFTVLKKIGSLQYQYIIPINWIILNRNELYFCSKFYCEPLHRKLNALYAAEIKDIILKLIEAAKYLNENGILFLAWTSNNLLLNEKGIPQLTNFHLGASLTSHLNIETTQNLVFPTILPPEFRFKYDHFNNADVWGICCLLKELLSKVVVHDDLIHLPREEVWSEMTKRGWKCNYAPRSIKSILHYGWIIAPKERSTLQDLEKHIRKKWLTA
ncbi:uncharacterized protein LOC115215143 [Octopus sinensis]|uniref:Uncharacterized protein LOC115215143 n=1 Tax=Octopus sinensis TaxID=2607531 RepID=A0A6P7SQJ0_9MOLL|nr:uncharacterized protein LOC115215143 [Octopus sinensis]